MFTKTN